MHDLVRVGERSISAGVDSLISRAVAFTVAGGGVGLITRLLGSRAEPREPADAVVILAAIAAVAVAAWWLANIAAWSIALREGRSVQRFTLPGTRRLGQLLLLVVLSTSCLTETRDGPAMVLIEGSPEPSSALPPTSGVGAPTSATTIRPDTSPSTPTTVAERTTATGPTTATERTAVTGPPDDRADAIEGGAADQFGVDPTDETLDPNPRSIPAHQVIVVEGDNLWSLAAEALERHGAPDPSSRVIADYWRLVIAGNQVRSGNPDLIVPGEMIELPAHRFSA